VCERDRRSSSGEGRRVVEDAFVPFVPPDDTIEAGRTKKDFFSLDTNRGSRFLPSAEAHSVRTNGRMVIVDVGMRVSVMMRVIM
jgi:hypothetical protein